MSSLFGSKPSSSLFGQQATTAPSQPAQTSSLFGNAQNQNTSANTSGNLFGGTVPSQPQQTSSLFPNLGGQPKPSPFSLNTSQPQTQQQSTGSSLFGAKPAQAQTGASLFGTSIAANPSQTAASSLFGSQQPQQQEQNAAQSQIQTGNSQAASTMKAAQPAYFDRLLDNARKRPRELGGDSSIQGLPSLRLGLGDISKRVRELGASDTYTNRAEQARDSKAHYLLAASGVNPGTTRRDLDTLAAQSTSFQAPPQSDWDPDSHRVVEQLRQRQTEQMMQEGLDRAKKRFDAFIEESVDINWELQRKKIYEHFGLLSKDADNLTGQDSVADKGSFGHSRRSKASRNKPAGKSTMNRSIFGQSSLQNSVIGSSGVGSANAAVFADVTEKNGPASSGLDDRYLRETQRKYAEKVQALNRVRLTRTRSGEGRRNQGIPFSVLREFLTIDGQPGGDSPKQIGDAYKALIEISKEGDAYERKYADEYLDEMPNSAKSIRIRKQIIDGSRRALEKSFIDQLETLLAKNPKEANIGGVPTTVNKVRAYVRIRAARKDLVPDGMDVAMLGQDYPWALIFHLLRCGLVKEAAEYVVGNAAHFKTIDRNIITFLTAFAKHPDRRLEGRMQVNCNNVYSSITKTAPEESVDPYRIACYKIIGRCELNRRSIDNVLQGVEDWIWLQFNLAREVNRADESAGEVFGLAELRETISEIGQRHFAAGTDGADQFGTFFYLQILGGMFEQAVAYLYSFSYTTAVHFAIALDYYGLLRVADFSASNTDLLTYNTKELPQLSFGRMIGYYTRDFRSGNVEAAADYLALICLNADLPGQLGKSQAALCHEAMRELVLETREFARLLGDIRSDGARIRGAIEDRLAIISLDNQEEFLQAVTTQAASVADDNGRITDAVLLYHLAEDYDNVVMITNRALSEAISTEIGSEPARLQPLKPRDVAEKEQAEQWEKKSGSSLSLSAIDSPYKLGQVILQLYGSNALFYEKVKPANREACGTLLHMGEAKSKVTAGQWTQAYEMISALNLLPLNASGSIPAIRGAATAFSSLPTPVARNVGPLLLWTITCIGRQRESLAQRQYEGGASKQLGEQLLSAAKDLMVFAGLLKYRLGERVWEAICGVGGDIGAY